MGDDLVKRLANIAAEARAYSYGAFADEADNARGEIERLRAEVASYKDAMEPRIRSLDAGDGVRMDLEGGACRLMAEWLADEYKRNSGINYVEFRFTSHEAVPGEAFIVTVQRVNGKTPNQLQKDAERECDALRGLAAATYQAAGAHDWPVAWLDALSNAASGHAFSTDGLLPMETPTAQRELAELRERVEKAPISCVTETDNHDMKSAYYAIAPQELDGHRVRLVRED